MRSTCVIIIPLSPFRMSHNYFYKTVFLQLCFVPLQVLCMYFVRLLPARMLRADIVFGGVCESVCQSVRIKSRKLLTRNWRNLVGISPMVNARSDSKLVTMDFDLWPWEQLCTLFNSGCVFWTAWPSNIIFNLEISRTQFRFKVISPKSRSRQRISYCFSIQALSFECLKVATSFSAWKYTFSISRSFSSFKVTGLISRSRSQNSGSVHVCAPLGHNLILINVKEVAKVICRRPHQIPLPPRGNQHSRLIQRSLDPQQCSPQAGPRSVQHCLNHRLTDGRNIDRNSSHLMHSILRFAFMSV